MLRKGHGGLYEAPTKEKSERLRGDGDKIKFIDLQFERWQDVTPQGQWELPIANAYDG